MRTFTGKRINLLNPQPEDIDINDIATGLSRIVRFSGQRRHCVTVAEHCVNGSFAVPDEHKLAFLLHDASEAYLGDIHGPLKHFLPDYCAIEDQLQRVICAKFNVVYPFAECIHLVDTQLRIYEDEHDSVLYETQQLDCQRHRCSYVYRFKMLYPEYAAT